LVVSAALLIRERGPHATAISDVLEHSGAPGAGGVIVTAVTTLLAWAQVENHLADYIGNIFSGSHRTHATLVATGLTEDGHAVRQELFVSLAA
jgi:hypothetical protein